MFIATFGQPPTQLEFLEAYTTIKDYEEVAAFWENWLEILPHDPQAHIALVKTYLYLGRPEDAIGELQRAIEIEPSFRKQGESLIQEIQDNQDPIQNGQ